MIGDVEAEAVDGDVLVEVDLGLTVKEVLVEPEDAAAFGEALRDAAREAGYEA